jgi:sulfatase modifying factor 1
MRARLARHSWAPVLVAGVALVALLGSDDDPLANRCAALVRQLGDDSFVRREEASKALLAVGEAALPSLAHGVSVGPDLEVRRRAGQLARTIMLAVSRSKSLTLQLVAVDAGEFVMGSPPAEADRRPDEMQHPVRITTAFLLGAYEVTQAQYQQVMNANPSWFQPNGKGHDKVSGVDSSRLPVECVTWYDAIEFCNRLSAQDGFTRYYTLADVKNQGAAIVGAVVTVLGGNGYRLPTEAEWEYACRASTTTPYHFGAVTKAGVLNCKPLKIAGGYGTTLKWPDLGRTERVGAYQRSGLGLYDMHGNVAEWCWDWYERDYYGQSPRDNPRGPDSGTHRVLRGGSWLISEGSCRSAARYFLVPDERKEYAGFRVARTPGPPAR